MTEKIRPPWTSEQARALNRFQTEGGMHPFTCGGDHAPGAPILVAREDGWHCSDPYREGCDYRQDWAHAFMADSDAWPKHPFATEATEATPLWERLTELSKLEDGWHDGDGKAPAREVLEMAGRIATALPHEIGHVRVYPTIPGGAQLEWSDGYGDHALEILADLHLVLLTVEPLEDAGVSS